MSPYAYLPIHYNPLPFLDRAKSFVADARQAADIESYSALGSTPEEEDEDSNPFAELGASSAPPSSPESSSDEAVDRHRQRLSTIADAIVDELLHSEDEDEEEDVVGRIGRAVSTSTLAAHNAAPNAAERLLCPSCAKRSERGEVSLSSLLLQGDAAVLAEEEVVEAKAWYEVAEDFIACPYDAFFKWTHPDPESRKWWPLTLLLSFAWVALLSFVISTIITRWVTVSGVPASFLG